MSTSKSETLLLSAADAERAGSMLRAGKLVVFPTETVYGLGADATREEAATAVYRAKGRPPDNPLIVHLADLEALRAAIPRECVAARTLAEAFCPGPMTLVVPAPAWVAPGVRAGLGTVGLRVPAHPVAAAVLMAAGRPIAAPSANRSGRPSPTSFAMAQAEMDGRVDAIVDGGDAEIGLESTVVDARDPREVRILRPGAVDAEAIARVVPIASPAFGVELPPSPGTRYRHYAPAVPVWSHERGELVERIARQSRRSAEIGEGAGAGLAWFVLGPGRSEAGGAGSRCAKLWRMASWEEYGRKLYRILWEAERHGASEILLELPPDTPARAALRDRIERAARGDTTDTSREPGGSAR